MGQQQLLLLVLGIIIVGLAFAFGIAFFGINNTKANADAIVNEALRIASDIQVWAVKPGMVGGRGSGDTIADVVFADIGYASSGGSYFSRNGEYTLSTSLGSSCDAPIIPSGKSALIYINATNDDTGNNICVAIAGTEAADIGTDAKYGSGITE